MTPPTFNFQINPQKYVCIFKPYLDPLKIQEVVSIVLMGKGIHFYQHLHLKQYLPMTFPSAFSIVMSTSVPTQTTTPFLPPPPLTYLLSMRNCLPNSIITELSYFEMINLAWYMFDHV